MIKTTHPSTVFRFIVSLSLNICRAGTAFATALLLARFLGPEEYGRFAFLTASLLSVRQLIDMATSQAFFTFLSKRPRSSVFIRYFYGWVFGQLIISVLLIGLILPTDVLLSLWQGEDRYVVVLALIAVFMQHHVWYVCSSVAESNRQNILVHKISLMITLTNLLVMILLWKFGFLVLHLIFIALILEWFLAACLVLKNIRTPNLSNDNDFSTRKMFFEFWQYCKYLIPYTWLAFAYGFFDRWVLQYWGGAAEQAYYSVALQFSAVALLATSSVIKIFWKEVAESFYEKNFTRVRILYFKATRIFYMGTASIVCAFLPWGKEVLILLLGPSYSAGAFTFMLMLLYPVHQALNQLTSTVLYATENVKIQTFIGYFFMVGSIILTYFLLAPNDSYIPGLGLNSAGLAIKMLVMQFIQVSLLGFYVSKVLESKFDFAHQIIGLSCVVAISYACKFIIVESISTPIAFQMIIYGILYVVSLSILLMSFPSLISLEREDVRNFLSKFVKQ